MNKPHSTCASKNSSNTTLRNSLGQHMPGVELSFLTNTLAAIYQHSDANDLLKKILPHLKNFDKWTIARIQKWYAIEKVTHWYETSDTLEKKFLRTQSQSVRPNVKWSEPGVFVAHEWLQEKTQEFQKDIEYGLKNFVEILARPILEAKLTNLWWKEVKVFLASDNDDVWSGVDLILTFKDPKTEQVHTIWIDVATSQDEGYLDDKSGKNTCTPEEFHWTQWKPEGTSVPRIVFAISPEKMAKILQDTLRDFAEGKPITTTTVAKKFTWSWDIVDMLGYGIEWLINKIQIRTNWIQAGI